MSTIEYLPVVQAVRTGKEKRWSESDLEAAKECFTPEWITKQISRRVRKMTFGQLLELWMYLQAREEPEG